MAAREEWERVRPTLWGPSRTLGDALDPSHNSFGFLRLAFAFAVLVDHAFPLGGFIQSRNPIDRLTSGQQTLAGLAVAGFFVISGYLVTRSYTQSRTAVRYFWKRVLRIFPAFLVCLLLTASFFGLLAYHRQYGGFSGYLSLSPDSPWGYFYRNMFLEIHQWNIGNLLQATPYQHNPTGLPQAFNGSLWTLIYEFKCYIGVAILGVFGILARARIVVLMLTVGLWAMMVKQLSYPSYFHAWPVVWDPSMVSLGFLFGLGAVLFLYRDSIPISGTSGLVAVLVLLISFRTGTYMAIGQLALAYLCLWFAIALPLSHVDRYGDFSYGVYIYAFVIEQMLSLYGWQKLGFFAYVFLATLFTALLAMASWFLIEKPAMKLKRLRLGEAARSGFRGELKGWRRVWDPARLAAG
jgi:peptidoglycan/LPS O-acetylase OafA/YrhL